MKKIRILVVALLMFILCGCSGNYNLTFNDDLTLTEELDISIKNEDNSYEKTLDLFNRAEIDSNKYDVVTDEDYVYIKYTEEYSTIEDYLLNSNLYHVLFDDIEYSKDNVGMKIGAENSFKLDGNTSGEIVNAYDIDNLKINVKIPFSINKSNADSKEKDVLTWEVKRTDTSKDINIDFSYKKASTISIVLLVLLGGAVIGFVAFIIINLLKSNKL